MFLPSSSSPFMPSGHLSMHDLKPDYWPQMSLEVYFMTLSAGEGIQHIVWSHARVSN